MKSNFIIKSTCTIAVLALISCQNETNEMYLSESASNSLSLEQLEKIAYGCDSYVYDIDSDEKVETSASDEYMALIEERMTQLRANKSLDIYDGNNQMVGVIKTEKSCGKYDEIEIFYDCEDGNNNTNASGFIGQWSVQHNITMRFCLVPAVLFFNNDLEYGVVNFSDAPYNMITNNKKGREGLSFSQIHVHMDAEDRDTRTKMWKISNSITNEKKTLGSVKIDNNGNLDFSILVSQNRSEWRSDSYEMPNLGMEYGVFGTICNGKEYFGKVYSDDENKNNANYMYWNDITNADYRNNNFYKSIIDMGKNTEFKISRISIENQRG